MARWIHGALLFWQSEPILTQQGHFQVALWNQKAAREKNTPVIWDYHTILVLEPNQTLKAAGPACERPRSWVYDFDTLITPVPCSWLGKPLDQ
jgi:hypothetical protein